MSGDMELRHEPENSRFVAVLSDGQAVLDYQVLDNGVWNMAHTFVPPDRRRQGIGADLVRYALDQLAEDGTQIIPGCWFVADFIADNPSYRKLVSDPSDR